MENIENVNDTPAESLHSSRGDVNEVGELNTDTSTPPSVDTDTTQQNREELDEEERSNLYDNTDNKNN